MNDRDPEGKSTISPDEAFSALGNEVRIQILRTLGETDDPIGFSELRDRAGLSKYRNFNYHLSKLEGHFVRKTDDGYELRQAGRQVIQAILSGAVTEDPVLEPMQVDEWSCPYCGAPTEIEFREGRVLRYCTEYENGHWNSTQDDGFLGALSLPPAGIKGRTTAEVLRAACTWAYAEWLEAANGVCPRCSASVEHSISVCEDHSATGEFCDECGLPQAVGILTNCTNCNYRLGGLFSMYLAGTTEMLDFMTTHGVNPFSGPWGWSWEYDEEIISINPFEARFTFSIDDDNITLTVDDNLNVVDVTVT